MKLLVQNWHITVFFSSNWLSLTMKMFCLFNTSSVFCIPRFLMRHKYFRFSTHRCFCYEKVRRTFLQSRRNKHPVSFIYKCMLLKFPHYLRQLLYVHLNINWQQVSNITEYIDDLREADFFKCKDEQTFTSHEKSYNLQNNLRIMIFNVKITKTFNILSCTAHNTIKSEHHF